jgi:membrane associated rhomboid family serine protease
MESSRKSLFTIIAVPLYLVLTLWTIHLLKLTFNLNLGQYGVMPREVSGLIGVIAAPFIHGSLQHLFSNTIPLFVLTAIMIIFYHRVAYKSLFMIYLLTGLAVWLFARGRVVHIGASGVVYGLVSFVFWTGLFRRNIKSIILALLVTILYSGYFMGILPNQKGISWESHLFGAFAGILVAYWYKDDVESDENTKPSWADEEQDPQYFLPRDTFDKTMYQRQMEARSRDSENNFWTSDSSS